MAYIPTLCEVTYDTDWFDDDRFFTPYRLSGSTTQNTLETASLYSSFPSYFDYLRTYYIEQSTSPTTNGAPIPSPSLPSRSQTTFTWYVPVTDGIKLGSGIKYDRSSSLHPPSLPAVTKPISNWTENVDDAPQPEPTGDNRIKWIDALNTWVNDKHIQDKPYLSFVNTAPVIKKYHTTLADKEAFQRRVAEKKNADVSTRRQSRKAYSTPLYNPESRRSRIVRFEAPHTSSNTPVPPLDFGTPLAITDAWDDEVESNSDDHEDELVKEIVMPTTLKGDVDQEELVADEGEVNKEDTVKPEEDHKNKLEPDPEDSAQTDTEEDITPIKKEPSFLPPLKTSDTVKKQSPPKKPPSPKKTVLVVKPPKTPRKSSPVRKPVSKPPKVRSKTAKGPKPKPEPDHKPTPLPVSDPVVSELPIVADLKENTMTQLLQSDGDTQIQRRSRSPVKKKERVNNRRKIGCVVEGSHQQPDLVVQKKSDWIFDADSSSETEEKTELSLSLEKPVLPALTIPDLPKQQGSSKHTQKKMSALRIPIESKKRWGPHKRDTSYEDELRRLELAEQRRKRQSEMYKRLRKKKSVQVADSDEENPIPNFDDYGFLAKYCIFSRSNLEMYRRAFDAVDDEHHGWLTGTNAMIALRGTNTKLTNTEEQYLHRILELTGYKIANGADFKLFSVLAALSQKISALDNWMKFLIEQMDFKILEMKMFMCKTLWECSVDPETNRIPFEELMIELRAGGVSFEHECEVRNKLGHLSSLDLMDFLTYLPLFIMIHESVVDNPLDDSRLK